MPNDPQYAISGGSSLQYELTKLEDVPEAVQAAVDELEDFYNKAKKFSTVTIGVCVTVNQPPDLPPVGVPYLYKEEPPFDPNLELSEQEKWGCVGRWLNAMWRHRFKPSEFTYDPCNHCPVWRTKCSKQVGPPAENFRILEKFTGEGTIVGLELHGGAL